MNKKMMLIVILICSKYASAQSSIVDTEVHLHKIDSVFHVFANFMGDVKKGNVDMLIIRSSLTIGSRFGNNLFRLTWIRIFF
jgi:hypothetical protein